MAVNPEFPFFYPQNYWRKAFGSSPERTIHHDTDPIGGLIVIVGTNKSEYEMHLDLCVRFKTVVNETAEGKNRVYGIGVFAVKMGADVFEVGRLPDEYLPRMKRLEGHLAQIWSVYGKSRTRRKLQKGCIS